MLGNSWFDGVQFCQESGKAYVLLTIMGSMGSTPRAQGSKMVITDDRQFDTIGGGQLEFEAIKHARELLANGSSTQEIQHFPLGAKLAQCCGGATHVLYEVMNQGVPQIAVFGAGHVAKALIPIIAQLPIQIHWIDNRAAQFENFEFPTNVSPYIVEQPKDALASNPTLTHVIVMTHNHQLDYSITAEALSTKNLNFVGLIGSQTKARRFKTRLTHIKTINELEKLHCPIGLSSVPGKLPIEVAVSISAQLIGVLSNDNGTQDNRHDKQTIAKRNWLNTKEIIGRL
ncbi:xanthine dehydrogenase accessory protein XdhC [Aliiglaciecola sp.]|nr:xanthine dehydrogenase accessory protein XdhC [Aliiglaciecola sp.]